METNEIMKNEEVIEVTEQVVTNTGSGRGIKVVAGVGLAVVAGVIVYKYVAKPIMAKIKAQKEQELVMAEPDIVDVPESDDMSEETSEES